MKQILAILVFLLFRASASGQQLISGDYDFGLKISYNEQTMKLSGYFENYTGYDETISKPKFSCIFYIEGTLQGKFFKIKTFYPIDRSKDIIEGTLEIIDSKTVLIKLPEEHGGCWNVQHFADAGDPARFSLEKRAAWIDIKYIEAEKSYFLNDDNIASKAYLVKGDFVCVEKIENERAYCAYYGSKTTKGWIKIKDLNK